MRIERWRLYQASSLLVAVTLSAWPLPESYAPWQPQWAAMIMIFWISVKPDKVGFGMAWAAGLLNDLVVGSWIGVHAFSYCLIAFLCIRFYRVLQLSTTMQKTLPVGLLLTLHLGCMHLSSIFLSNVNPGLEYWACLPASLLAWPALHWLLEKTLTEERRKD